MAMNLYQLIGFDTAQKWIATSDDLDLGVTINAVAVIPRRFLCEEFSNEGCLPLGV